MGDVQMANRPFYRYGGHMQLISFKEYYGMTRGHELDPIYSFGIYARFSVLNSKKKTKEAIKIVDTPKKLVWSFTVLFLT